VRRASAAPARRPRGHAQLHDDDVARRVHRGAWRSTPKHVFSRAEGKPFTGEALRELKAASDGILSISGPGLAAVALREGEVDEVARYIVPVCLGGGTPWWPGGVRASLELLDQQVLTGGWMFLRYAVKR